MSNKRIPVELKIVRGTDQPCRRKKNQPFEKLFKSPEAPEYLTKYGRALWKRLCPVLIEKGLLAAAYLPALEVLCESYAVYREAHDVVYGSGKGRQSLTKYLEGKKQIETVAYKIMKAAFQDFRLYLVEFGLSPSSKTGVNLSAPVDDKSIVERMWNKRHDSS